MARQHDEATLAEMKLSATPGRVERRPPRFGENTDEVLRELGYTASEIADLRAERIAG